MILNGYWTTARVGLKWPLDVQETKSMVTKLAILCFLFDHYNVDCQRIVLLCNRSSAFFFLLQSLTSNPHHDSYLSFLGRNLDLRTSMLGAGSSVTVKISLTNHDCIHEFPQITLCLPVNSRITQNLFQTLIQWCQFKTARTPFATSFSMPFYVSSYCSGFVISTWCSWKVGAWDERM